MYPKSTSCSLFQNSCLYLAHYHILAEAIHPCSFRNFSQSAIRKLLAPKCLSFQNTYSRNGLGAKVWFITNTVGDLFFFFFPLWCWAGLWWDEEVNHTETLQWGNHFTYFYFSWIFRQFVASPHIGMDGVFCLTEPSPTSPQRKDLLQCRL